MLYESLELKGYKRMALGGVNHFIIKPTKRVQLILGTNGSGKSSLISVLNPLPADKADFTKEGCKIIKIRHNGRSYVLSSVFSPKVFHSFLKDGVELNDGGTMTVQTELVKKEFGYDKDVHGILNGNERFTTMSPSKRREWFTRLSDVNYDYAIGVYGRMKDLLRDVSGAMKMANKHLVAETAKLMSPEEMELLEKEVTGLEADLAILQKLRSAPETDYETAYQIAESSARQLAQLSVGYNKVRAVIESSSDFVSMQELDNRIEETKRGLTVVETQISALTEEFEKLQQTQQLLVRTGNENERTIIEKINYHTAERNKFLAKMRSGVPIPDPERSADALKYGFDILENVFDNIPSNEDKRFSQRTAAELEEKIINVKSSINQTETKIAGLIAKKNHLEQHLSKGEVSCPKCAHRFHPGFSADDVRLVDEQIQKETEQLAALNVRLNELRETEEEFTKYRTLFSEYSRFVRSAPQLNLLWDTINEKELLIRSPRACKTLLMSFHSDHEFALAAETETREIARLTALKADAEQVSEVNVLDIDRKLSDAESKLGIFSVTRSHLNRQLIELSTVRKDIVDLERLAERIKEQIADLTVKTQYAVETKRREMLAGVITKVQVILARKAEALNAASMQKGIVDDLKSQISRYEKDEAVLKSVMRELSPTEGLIAEGMLGFIRNFVGQMNILIRKVWTYPLVIKECGSTTDEGTELDYVFPLMVQTKDNVAPDISKGSTGMREIVDMAFKLVAMIYLGLSDAPLFLDEFSASFDDAHRDSAMEMLKTVLEQQSFSQLYMVSHYQASYGKLSNVETCVLCPNNITVPDQDYNKHVYIN